MINIIKPESNNEKILLDLIANNRSLSVKILAENTRIPYKNIHRNLKQLFEGGFIDKRVSQEGRNRYTYISLTVKGMDFKTYMQIEPIKHPKLDYSRANGKFTDLYNGVQPDSLKFGIRFYSWFAREMEIPNYSNLRLNELKFQIGMKLLDESESDLDKAISKPLTLNDIELLDGE